MGPGSHSVRCDVVFQPLKVERSGLFDAVNGNVLIYVHKEQELETSRTAFLPIIT